MILLDSDALLSHTWILGKPGWFSPLAARLTTEIWYGAPQSWGQYRSLQRRWTKLIGA
jgi:hypothetical protein